jgi:hypothetical protein
MRRSLVVALFLILSLATIATARAQSPQERSAQPAQGGIPGGTSPEKLALLRELYRLMKAGEPAEKSSLIMLDQLRDQLPGMISRAYGDLLVSNAREGKTLESLKAGHRYKGALNAIHLECNSQRQGDD